MIEPGRLFDPDEFASVQPDVATQPSVDPAPPPAEQMAMAVGKRNLVFDDEGSWSREISSHSLNKDHFVFRYANIVAKAIVGQGKFRAVWWIEPFAGPGRLALRNTNQYYAGSALRALEVKRPFDGYIFNDMDAACVAALRPRIEDADARVTVLQEDANSIAFYREVVARVPQDALVVLYGDPSGLDLDFETLERFAAEYPKLDLLLNFPCRGIIRALAGGQTSADPANAPGVRRAGRVLDDDSPLELTADGLPVGVSVRDRYRNRLEGIGYTTFGTETIRLHSTDTEAYDLLLASHSSLARKFFDEARGIRRDGQYAMRLQA